jgi:hypothetical protein
VLSAFRRAGLIETNERSLTILDHRYAIIADGDGVPQAETVKSKRRLTACIRTAM